MKELKILRVLKGVFLAVVVVSSYGISSITFLFILAAFLYQLGAILTISSCRKKL